MLDAGVGNYDRELRDLQEEISLHDPCLAERPYIVIVSKTDLLPEAEVEALRRESSLIPVSALTGYGLREFVVRLFNLVDTVCEEEDDEGGEAS
jgi:GTPase involved in cell partitioning and DNA repair